MLGHIVSKAGIAVDLSKVKVIVGLVPLVDVTGVKSFLGHTRYYIRFIKGYAVIAMPLTALTKKVNEFVWTAECQTAFEALKIALSMAPVLIPPDWSKEFHVHIDASAYALGNILSQLDSGQRDHPIYYASIQLSGAERNYTTTEREALSIVLLLQKFRHYLLGYAFVFYTDHYALKYMVNQPELTGRFARWMLLF